MSCLWRNWGNRLQQNIPQVKMLNEAYQNDYFTGCLPLFGSHFTPTYAWWRHQMETFSMLLAICAGNSPVPGEFSAQRPVTRSFGVFFDLRFNKRLSKQSWGWWFEMLSRPLWRQRKGTINSLAPGWFKWKLRQVIFKLISVINGWGIFCEIIPRRMWLDFTDDKSTLVQVMAWCHQATSHYLRQCWPSSMSPYSIIRPQLKVQAVS